MELSTVTDIVDDLFLAFRGFERFEEPGRPSEDRTKVSFGWGNWLDEPLPVVLKNDQELTLGGSGADYTVDYTKGIISLTNPLAAGDEVRAIYTMRLFSKDIYNSFIPVALSMINSRKPQTNYLLGDAPDNYLAALVLYTYIQTARMLLLKMGMFKWRRLFEVPDDITLQLRTNLQESSAQFDLMILTLKRRGLVMPAAVTGFVSGRSSPWAVDNVNFNAFIVSR